MFRKQKKQHLKLYYLRAASRFFDSVFYSFVICVPSHIYESLNVKAGFLASGSSESLRLPIRFLLICFNGQWQRAGFVPDYSGGTAPDSNGIPC